MYFGFEVSVLVLSDFGVVFDVCGGATCYLLFARLVDLWVYLFQMQVVCVWYL